MKIEKSTIFGLPIYALLASMIFHGVILFYPIQYIIQKYVQPETSQEVEPENKSIIQIQLVQVNQESKFVRLDDSTIDDDLINNSNILSNKNHTSENKLIGENSLQESNTEDKEVSENGFKVSNKIADDNAEVTDVSTVKFKYFDYYMKVKESIEPRWDSRISKAFEGIKLNEEVTLKTILILKINREGEVKDIMIGESSGLTEVDKIAMTVFENQTIEAPPVEIFNGKEYLYLYWGFALKL